ncbi:hypothetical protein PVAG01_10306 [Phlyctema vagabunda]|uniref:C2H2-type domain-containing protein n=1 Tax=Phlyctema vagabunda TaxID=108571 RepID=A0ABR4P5K7_9HELO
MEFDKLNDHSHTSEEQLKNEQNTQLLAQQQNYLRILQEWVDNTPVPSSENGPGSAAQSSIGFVWGLYQHTLKIFSFLNTGDDKLFKRSLGKLFLWGDSFRDGKLDNVLDESDNLKGAVVASLVGIGKVLLHKQSQLDLGSPNRSNFMMQDMKVLIEKAHTITSEDHDEDTPSDSSYQELTDDPLLRTEQVAEILMIYVDNLMDLVPSMEDTLESLNDQLEDDLAEPVKFQVSAPAQPYAWRVYDKYPRANIHLIERLAEANWQRHISLRSTEDQPHEEKDHPAAPKMMFTSTSVFHDSGIGSSAPARSTYAATVVSHSSFKSTTADKENSDLRVRSTPKEVFEGIPFICQICGSTLSKIKNRVDWRRHVFADLKPYMCTFAGCKEEFKKFPERSLWEEHEFSQHRLNNYWKCSDCSYRLPTEDDWCAHVKSAHGLNSSDPQYRAAALFAKSFMALPIELQDCPLCLSPGRSRRQFVTHVGKHMEGIALSALPRSEETAESDEEEVDFYGEETADLETAEKPGFEEYELYRLDLRADRYVSSGIRNSMSDRELTLARDQAYDGYSNDIGPLQRPLTVAEIKEQFISGPCLLEGCRSTKVFVNYREFIGHIKRVHVGGFYCTIQGCILRRPFAKKGELDRHIAAKHLGNRNYICSRYLLEVNLCAENQDMESERQTKGTR